MAAPLHLVYGRGVVSLCLLAMEIKSNDLALLGVPDRQSWNGVTSIAAVGIARCGNLSDHWLLSGYT